MSGSSGPMSEILRPSNQVFPRYSMLRYASIMLRLTDFPNLLGLVKRYTSLNFLRT